MTNLRHIYVINSAGAVALNSQKENEIVESSTGQKIDYIASSANSYLINDMLRRTYGFGGFVVGDCGAWDNAYGRTPLRKKLYPELPLEEITSPMTVAKIIEAGSSLDCNSGSTGTGQVLNAVKQGLISEDMLDIVVYELFLARMKTGEFDAGAKYQDTPKTAIETEESNDKAREAAEETWALLENKNNSLPLKSDVKNIAVVGDYAEDVILGDYSADMDAMKQAHLVTPIDGIQAAVKEIAPDAEVNMVGNMSGNTPLFNIKSIKLVRDGKDSEVDLTTATTVIGMEKSGAGFNNVTGEGTAIIPNVNFNGVSAIKIEAASLKGMPTVKVVIGYGSASQPAGNVQIAPTADENTYVVNEGVYDGATGGYTETRDMYITISASTDFSVENYKDSLEAADYIIAYAGTTTSDSSESHDRSSIDLPSGQSHVQKICDEYPDKTIVVMQTVGQINVEGFKDKCAAMLWTSYNGQQQGTALGKILTGAVNPSGKLTTTWYSNADLTSMLLGSPVTKEDGINYHNANYELAYDITNKGSEFIGRTYQYYKGTPIYPFGYGLSYANFEYSNMQVDKASADANDTVKVSVDVKNTGTVSAEEVVQLYISVPGAGSNGVPIKQLKNFEKVELAAGETKNVTMDLEVADVYFWDEATQKNYVVEGEYTLYAAKNANDTSTSTKLNVSGSIAETLKRVYSIPSGLTVYTAKDSTGANADEPGNFVDAGVSVSLKNDKVITDFAANGITMKYESANPAVATVDANGIVKAGGTNGVTTITVTASKEGSADVMTTFPIVAEEAERISDSLKAQQLDKLNSAYATCPKPAYSAEDWAKIEEIYNTTKSFVENTLLPTNVELTVDKAVEEMLAIPKMEIQYDYSILPVNAKDLENGVVDYDPNGIGTYTATATTISGTVAEANPCNIPLQVIGNGATISSGITWTVDKIDSSSRKPASIDGATGVFTVYENGIYRVTAADYTSKRGASLDIYVNLQLEAENSTNASKVSESDAASGGKYLSSTLDKWFVFKDVKMEGLAEVTLRVEQSSADATVNVSMTPNKNWTIATGTVPAGEGWTEITLPVNENVMKYLTFDDNGCATIYVQTNKANFDYAKLDYNTGALKVTNADGGKMIVETPATEATVADASRGTLISTVYNENGSIKKVSTTEITGDTTEISGFEHGDKVTIYVWDGMDSINPLAEKTVHIYNEAQPKMTKIMYNFSDPNFDSLFGSAENTIHDSGLGMIGYGGWQQGGSGSYNYDGVTYSFTRSLKGGNTGSNADDKIRQMIFTPDSDGTVTAFFKANTSRWIGIAQNGELLNSSVGNDSSITIVQANVTAGSPVHVYGGGSNKELHGVLFEPGKSVEVVKPTPTPEPTEPPVLDLLPEDQILTTMKIECEDYTAKADTGSKLEDLADGNKTVGSTRNGDIFYYGVQNMDNLGEISIYTAIRNDAGDATATFYAADVTGVDVTTANMSSFIKNENMLGTVALIPDKNWNTYYENRLRGFSSSGQKGLFVKLASTGKYAGNHDRITLTYLKPDATTAAEEVVETTASLAAENDNAMISIAGDVITSVDKMSGEISVVNYSTEYGSEVEFKKLINANGMLMAIIKNTETGKTDIVSSPGGTVWMVVTPTEFSENDTEMSEFVINDILVIEDQIYVGCSGGVLLTMPPCSKCCTAKKLCDFDIVALEKDEDTLVLIGADNQNEAVVGLSDARQSNIQSEAALQLAGEGAILVDVRSAEEFAEKHIEGSVNVPIDEFEEWIKTQCVFDTFIVFCASGIRASKAVDIAKSLGYIRTYNLGSIDELLN